MKIKTRELLVAADVLDRARGLIAEKGWCQGEFAVNEAGEEVDPHSPDATHFCVVGAIVRVAELEMEEPSAKGTVGPRGNVPLDLFCRFLKIDGETAIADWNDAPGRTPEDAINTLGEAAAAARTLWSSLPWYRRLPWSYVD